MIKIFVIIFAFFLLKIQCYVQSINNLHENNLIIEDESCTVRSKYQSILQFKQNQLIFGNDSFMKIDENNVVLKNNINFRKGIKVNTELVINNKKQWLLYKRIDVNEYPEEQLSKCGQTQILGGYCIQNKNGFNITEQNLPQHGLIKLKGKVSFLDMWQGEQFYIQLMDKTDTKIIYTESSDLKFGKNLQNFCGNSYADQKLFQDFEVIFKHNQSQLLINFNSTLEDDPCTVSYGISNIEIYFIQLYYFESVKRCYSI